MWRHLWLCPFYLVISSLPLLTPVGRNLEYEYATIVSALVLLILPLIGLFTPSHLLPRQTTQNVTFEIFWIFIISPVALFLPGLFIFAVGACSCSPNGFIFWLLLQAYPAWVIGHGLYHAVLHLRSRGLRRARLALGIFLLYALLVLNSAAQIWMNPQVRISDVLLGFLHGPIYDRWLPIDAGVPLTRAAHALLGVAILSWVFYRPTWKYRAVSVLIVTAWLGCTFAAMPYATTGMGAQKLNLLLPRTLSHPRFLLHYQPSPTGEIPAPITRIYRETEFHIKELDRVLGPSTQRVDVYVYPTQTLKKLWFGGGSTDVTDVRTPSIHITTTAGAHPTLRHELVHALASEFGFYGLGFHPNMAFTEGLAVALAPEEDEVSLHTGAASLVASRRIGDINSLFSPLFWSESGARSYTVAGSIIKFLIDQYGTEPVKRLYSGESWEEVFGSNKNDTLVKWREFIFTGFDPSQVELYTESLYRNPGVFGDQCPHTKADYRQSRDANVWVRLRQPVDWEPESDYWPWRVAIDGSDLSARQELWQKKISELIRHPEKNRQQDLQEWLDTATDARRWPPKTIEDIELQILASDLLAALHKHSPSRALLKEIAEFSATHDLPDGIQRQVTARLLVESLQNQKKVQAWRTYLAGWAARIPELPADAPWILTYLHLRRGSTTPNPSDLKHLLNKNVPAELPPTFAVEWYRLIGQRAIKEQAYDLAEQAYLFAASHAPAASVEFFNIQARMAKHFSQTAVPVHR